MTDGRRRAPGRGGFGPAAAGALVRLREEAALLVRADRGPDAWRSGRAIVEIQTSLDDPFRDGVARPALQVLLRPSDLGIDPGRLDGAYVRYDEVESLRPDDPLAAALVAAARRALDAGGEPVLEALRMGFAIPVARPSAMERLAAERALRLRAEADGRDR